MKQYILITYIFFCSIIYSQCEFSSLLLTMEDSWGDGWNGSTFCLNNECTTLNNGSLGTEEFCVDLEVENDVACGGGNWMSEVSWRLSDDNNNILLMGGAPFEGCLGGSCNDEINFPEYYEFSHDGLDREFYLYRPLDLQDNAPLVFVLHGYSGSANGMIGYSRMNEVADENGFAVCYPNGTSDDSGYNFWNVGYAFHQNEMVDDVDFLSALASHLQREYDLDYQNTYVTGFSNGGDMSYMLACQASDVFRAIAPVAGTMMEEIYTSCDTSPVPVFEIHGTNDNVTLWLGDMQNNDGWGAYYGTEDVIDFWIENNSCLRSEDINLPNSENDGSYIIHRRYYDCSEDAEVWLYEVVYGGHDWPGSSGNFDINASAEIWNFFNMYNFTLGDVNNDSNIDILDIVSLVNLILIGQIQASADMNEDGAINIQDIIILVNLILN